MRNCLLASLVLTAASGYLLEAQTSLPNSWKALEDRIEGLSQWGGPLLWSPSLGEGETWGLLPGEMRISYNSGFPEGLSDGAQWQGKGINTALSGGGFASGNFWFLRLSPEIFFSQNGEFTLNPFTQNPPYGDAHGRSWDHPERFGEQVIWNLSTGQSSAGLKLRPFRLVLGTANHIWGSSRYNGMLLSSEGPGVPKVALSLDPWEGPGGVYEGHMMFGFLAPSDFRPADHTGTGERLWSATFLGFTPGFLPQLTLGAARTSLSRWTDLKWQDFLMPLTPGINFGIDGNDQRISLIYRWKEPSVGMEMYGEWGRNDFSPSLTAWLLNTERTQAWVLGFRKSQPLPTGGSLFLEGEISVLSLGIESFINENGYSAQAADFYVHWLIKEGYTISGQDLGAAAGNGNMQILAAFWMEEDFFTGYEFRRWVKDYSVLVEDPIRGEEHAINVRYTHEFRGGVRTGPWEISFRAGSSLDMNRYFTRRDELNLFGGVDLRVDF